MTTVLRHPAAVKPGDTIYLRAGTYVAPDRLVLHSYLTGAAGQYITVRPWDKERVTIDGGFEIHGAWTIFRDLEVMNSRPARVTANTGPFPEDILQPPGFTVFVPNVRVINNIVHDTSTGLASWKDAADNEFYGNIVYYNGWLGGDRGHGHGVYMQNQNGTKWVTDNIVFSQFELGMQIYGSSGTFLNNFVLEGNIIFNSGVMANRYSRNILLGGTTVANNPVLRNNYTYFPTSWNHGGDNNIGYYAGGAGCTNLILENNYLVSGGIALTMFQCTVSSFLGNTLFGETRAFTPSTYPANTYLDRNRPSQYKVFVRPNRYETGRANIAIFNWTKLPTVPADLTGIGLVPGDSYEIVDAQNYYGIPVTQGVYSGAPVNIPMSLSAVAVPVGNVPYAPVHTESEFGAFVVRKTGTTSVPVPEPVALQVITSSASAVTTTSAVLNWTTNLPSTTQVEFGTTAALGSSVPEIKTLVTAHSVTLTGLKPATQYYTRLRSVDNTGQIAESNSVSFTTSPEPAPIPTLQISAGAASGITANSAVVTWITNIPATTQVEFGTTTALGTVLPEDKTLTTTHSATLTGLVPGTTYYIRLRSASAAGAVAENRTLSFSTPTPPPAPVPVPPLQITSPAASGISTNSATLTWTTSAPATTQVEFGITTSLGTLLPENTSLFTAHSVTLTNLQPGTLYCTRLRSVDATGQAAETRSVSFTTLAATSSTPPVNAYSSWLEAENGSRVGFPIVSDAQVSGGKYIYSGAAETGTVSYNVYVPAAGEYRFWFRALASDSNSASVYVSIDGTGEDIFDIAWNAWSPAWQWVRLSGRNGGSQPSSGSRIFSLKAGWHKLVIRSRQANTKLDGLVITSDPSLIPDDKTFTRIR